MEPLFTLEQIKNYILSQDSRGDILYNLNEHNILKANCKMIDKRTSRPNLFQQRLQEIFHQRLQEISGRDCWDDLEVGMTDSDTGTL